jgi:hypothetical protein
VDRSSSEESSDVEEDNNNAKRKKGRKEIRPIISEDQLSADTRNKLEMYKKQKARLKMLDQVMIL